MSRADVPAGAPAREILMQERSAFHALHPIERLKFGNREWTYVRGGIGDDVLLLLPGALGPEFAFPVISRLENAVRIVAPDYPHVSEMAELFDAISAMLDQEGVGAVHVLGGSYGGLIAQAFVRAHPSRVKSLILSHTSAPDSKLANLSAPLLWLFAMLPDAWLRWMFQKKLGPALKPLAAEQREFWSARLREQVARLSGAQLLDRARLTANWMRGQHFGPADLSTWSGRVLIIEGEGDPFVSPASQAALRYLYPQAEMYRFRGTGHISSLVRTDEFCSVVLRFLENRAAASAVE